ncbi:hypothetical protein OG883_43605 [Streptomyces sp. NBC_01142]|uniref:hypothetical protein n=1 Tax=Streptomyces sp. NBC_01142 TaxID=2975865 RepID=UPI00224F5347|nr:hypothetical protein [Streptomyces sp. NBC_01142]MCX4826527.1 hypothetical protein [Streptomyces sp. NBC_01142]
MAEPTREDLSSAARLGSGVPPGPRPHASSTAGPLTCHDADHNEKFIRMLIHFALQGERITGASEEGGNMTTADEKTDPFHVPLPAEVPVPAPHPEAAGRDGGQVTATTSVPAPADPHVDAPVDAVDAQVSAPEEGVPAPRGSGAEPALPPMPESPPATPEDDPDWWRVSRDEPKAAPPAKGSPRDTMSGWWDRLYKDQDADLDTYTGHVLTVPADGGPVLIEVQKSPEPEAPEPDEAAGEEPSARPQVLDVRKPQPTLQIRTQPVKRWRPTRFWRVITFNGTAAAVGSAIGLNAYLSQFPPAAVTAAGGLLGAGMALGGGFTAWKVAGSEMLAPFVPFGALGRLGAVFVSAEVGRRLGQALLPYTSDTIARYVGLSQADTSLLVVGLTMCGASGWLVWRTRHGGLLKRWLARIPLATSLLVCALYSNGPVI